MGHATIKIMNYSKAKKTEYGPYLTRKDWRKRSWPSGENDKSSKVLANRKVRRAKNVPDGNAYRKLYSSYDINDFKGPGGTGIKNMI